MRKLLAVALVGLMVSSANAAWVSIVEIQSGDPNLANHHPWTGGTPSLANGGVNFGKVPGAGTALTPSGTARIGVVIETVGTNNVGFASIFLAQNKPGGNGLIDLQETTLTAVNDGGDLWVTESYATGMIPWANPGGPEADVGGPLVDNAHIIANDDALLGGGGGNTGNQAFQLWELVIHGLGPVGGEAGLIFDRGARESELFTGTNNAFIRNSHFFSVIGHGGAAGNWFPRNGSVDPNFVGEQIDGNFPILIVIPEPASLSLLGIGALALLRRRVK